MSNPLIPSSTEPPYSIPLTAAQFDAALRKGHGRAWQHAALCGVSDRTASVLHALLHNTAYDPQCEGDRGAWTLGLVDAAGASEHIVPEFLHRGVTTTTDDSSYWHGIQRAGLLGILARRGYDTARESLYGMLTKNASSMDLIGAEEIIELDGADGLIHVCSVLGGWLVQDPSTVLDDAPLRAYDERHGDGAALRVLDAVRHTSPQLDTYLRAVGRGGADAGVATVGEWSERTSRPAAPPDGGHLNISNVRFAPGAGSVPKWIESRSAADIIQWIEHASPNNADYWLLSWGRQADGGELGRIAETLQSEEDSVRLQRYLRVFGRRPLPILSDRVIALGEHPDSQVRARAYKALALVSDARIRKLGLRMLTSDRMAEGSIALFQSSYKTGDHVAIEMALTVPGQTDDLHPIVSDLVNVFGVNPYIECLRSMLFTYEHSPCGNCRSRATKLLQATGTLPDWVARECRHDAMEDIRERFGTSSE